MTNYLNAVFFSSHLKSHFTQFNNTITEQWPKILDWISCRSAEYQNQIPTLYTSIDLRCGQIKIAPVDTNVFPAGFNNIAQDKEALTFAMHAMREYLEKYTLIPNVQKVLIIVEDLSRNRYYNNSIATLITILTKAGYITKVGSTLIDQSILIEIDHDDATVNNQNNNLFSTIEIEPLINKSGLLFTASGFFPEVIILNNDLTSGIPEVFKELAQKPEVQIIVPHYNLGWYKRSKYNHTLLYNALVKDLFTYLNTSSISELKLDYWLLTTYIDKCENVDFRNKIGLEILAQKVDALLAKIQLKYDQYCIKDRPSVFIKADNGTYGLGIQIAKSGNDILHINKKDRHRIAKIKSGIANHTVLLQETVPSALKAMYSKNQYDDSLYSSALISHDQNTKNTENINNFSIQDFSTQDQQNKCHISYANDKNKKHNEEYDNHHIKFKCTSQSTLDLVFSLQKSITLSKDSEIEYNEIQSNDAMNTQQKYYTAEKLIYTICDKVVSTLLRYHPNKNTSENLNSPGSEIALVPNSIDGNLLTKAELLAVKLSNLVTRQEI